ncbi:MAG: Ferredoxin, partial [uncultured Frankineae bacterium]
DHARAALVRPADPDRRPGADRGGHRRRQRVRCRVLRLRQRLPVGAGRRRHGAVRARRPRLRRPVRCDRPPPRPAERLRQAAHAGGARRLHRGVRAVRRLVRPAPRAPRALPALRAGLQPLRGRLPGAAGRDQGRL